MLLFGVENIIYCTWLNHSLSPMDNDLREFLGMAIGINATSHTLPGQDGRITLLGSDELIVSYTVSAVIRKVTGKYFRTGVANIRIDGDNRLVIENNRTLTPIQAGPRRRHEKNWTPFTYNGKLFFVVDINPMLVVRPQDEMFVTDAGLRQLVYFVSNSTVKSVTWEYGPLRGGTNAIQITSKAYLALFHSQCKLAGSSMNTYLMGAYAFTSQPPFRLLAVSRTPIVHPSLYAGPTFNQYRRKATSNYIVFPMSLFRGKDSQRVYVSLGTQDRFGWIAELNIKELLASLDPVG